MKWPLFLTDDPRAAQRVIPSSLCGHVETWELFTSIIVFKKIIIIHLKKKKRLGMHIGESYRNNSLHHRSSYGMGDSG